MSYHVYMLASQRNGTLYVGMTNDLVRRIWEHKSDAVEGFTKRYQVHTLVWFRPPKNQRLQFCERSKSRSGVAAGSWT